jgi:CRP/FNR family transcriptional regulator
MSQSCAECDIRSNAIFCNLPQPALEQLERVRITAEYPKDATLCMEGQDPRGVYIVCSGKVKLSATSKEGRSMILRMVDPGEVVGLTAALAGTPIEVTATTMEPSTISFVTRQEFLRLMQQFPDSGMMVINQLAHNYRSAYRELRSFGLSSGVAEKLARLLLEWLSAAPNPGKKPQFKLTITQEEIAELIGTTRETVSRQLSDFKKRGLIRTDGCTVTVLNRAELERIVS